MISLAIAWIVLGIAAFIYSLVCAGKTKSTGKIVLGVLLAIFFGPFYWIYYLADKNYCRESFEIDSNTQ